MKFILGALCAFAFVSPAAAAPLEAYGLLPQIEQVEISPDGARLAIMKTKGERRTIEVVEADTLKEILRADGGSAKVRSIMWADNDHLVFTVSQTTGSHYGTGALDIAAFEYATGTVINVATRKQSYLGSSISETLILSTPEVRTVDGKTTLFFAGQERRPTGGATYPGLMQTRPGENFSKVIKDYARYGTDWLIGVDGSILSELNYQSRTLNTLTVYGKKKLAIRPQAGFDISTVVGLGADGTTLIAGSHPFSGKGEQEHYDAELTYAEVSIDTGEWRATSMSSDVTDMFFDPRTKRLVGYVEHKGDVKAVTYIQPADVRAWNAVKKAFADSDVTVASWSENRRKVVVEVDSPTLGPAYALVDLNTGQAKWIGDAYPIIDEDVSPVKPIAFKAADGLDLSGYLTTPYGKEAKALPLIVLAHGGPASRDVLAFDWWAQALASRGYAVLQVNFRGSTGFGQAFRNAGSGEWGKKMQTDLSDGVRYLVAQGVVDPKRVCITGASYGGYAALAGATIDRGVYRCASAISGPADLKRMLESELQTSGRNTLSYWKKFMGVETINDPALAAISPVLLADRVDIPLQLIHGKDDSVVFYEQTTRMADAMAKAGKPVEVVTLAGEDHWLSQGTTRLKMLQSLVAFLEKHNPPDRQVAVAAAP